MQALMCPGCRCGVSRRSRRRTALAALASAFLAAPAAASAPEAPALVLRGFGTLGLARSTSAEAQFLRDISQPKGASRDWSGRIDSIAGLQLNYRAGETAEVVLQGVSHYRYDGSFRPELTWAFLKYDPNPRISLRLGRIGTEFMMQSDSRMVGYAYLPVRPPVEYFGAIPNYGDGADLQLRWPVGEGVLRGRFAMGIAKERIPLYDLDGSQLREASIGYEGGPWQVRYIRARNRFAQDIPSLAPLRASLASVGAADAADALGLAGTLTRFQSLGVAYDDGSWQMQAAASEIRHGTVMFENLRAAYGIVGYRFGSITPFIGYSRGSSTPKSLDTGLPQPFFGPLNDAVATVLRSSHLRRSTYTLGARWDFARNMDLKAQVDFVRGDASSLLLTADPRPGWNGRTNVYSLALDFVF